MACKDKDKFVTAEAASKAALRTQGIIDEFLNIKQLQKFRETVRKWSDDAKQRFGIQERLFFEDGLKAVPNRKAFQNIDRAKGINYQIEEVPTSTSSPQTISKIKEVAKKMGVQIQSLSDYIKGNPDVDVRGINALADLVKGVIAVSEGKEEIALTEEVVHIATAMLEQTHPQLITEMISKIGRFKIYKTVLDNYKNNKAYQLSTGKPDIRKVKKEAVDKLITELIINQSEGSTEFPELQNEIDRTMIRNWWIKILDIIRGMYKKANIDIFEEIGKTIINTENYDLSKIQSEKSYRRGENIDLPGDFNILWDRSTDGNKLQRYRGVYNTMGSYNSDTILGETDWTSLRKKFNDKLNTTDVDREQIFSHTLISLIRSTYGNTFNKGVAKKLNRFKYIIVNNPRLSPITAKGVNIFLNINEESSFINHIFNNTKEGNEWELLDTMVSEELIHLVSSSLTTSSEMTQAYAELTQEDKIQILQTYFHDYNLVNTTLLKPFQYVHEYVRMQIQKKVLGYTTEEKRTTLKKIIDRVWDYLKDLLPKYTSLRRIYNNTLNFIETGEGDIYSFSEGELGLPILSKSQLEIQTKILETQNILRKVESKEAVDPIFMDTEEANNWYELLVNGVWVKDAVKKRVTDRVKIWYKQKFPNKTFTPEEKKFNETKRTFGVKGHGFFEEIHGRYFNPDGTRKTIVGERSTKLTSVDGEVYNKLENYFTELIGRFSKDALVFSEVKVYDPKQKEAGTLDLLIIDENGKANIFDWKFMSVSDKAEDIAWFKQGAFNIQLGRYKEILQKVYGVKEMGMNRAIPILMEFREDVKTKEPILKGIVVGSVDSSKITDLKLIPVSEQTESTGEEALDEIIKQLNSIYKQVGKQVAITDDEKEFKSVRLNTIKKAVRMAQGGNNLTPLIEVIKQTRKDGDLILNDYKTIYEGKIKGEFTEKQLSDFANEMREYISISDVFGNTPDQIGSLIYTPEMETEAITEEEKETVAARKEILQSLEQEAKLIRISKREIDKASSEFADKFIGIRNLVSGLLDPKTVVKGLAATFRGVSELPLPSLQLLFKLVENAKARASQIALGEVDELLEIRKKLSTRGGELRKLVQQIYLKDEKGKIANRLIYKYQKEFFTKIDENAKNEDIKWLKDNIDVVGYKEEADRKMNDAISQIKKKHSDEEIITKLIQEEQEKWDIDNKNFKGWNNYIIKRHPLTKWQSPEYNELAKDAELLELYNFIVKINEKAKEAGYLQNKGTSTFLPFVRKSFAESLAWDMSLSAVKNWGQSFVGKADDVGYGSVNEFTGELENSIPKYYTYDFTKQENGENDHSDVSEDLFKNIILYINHMEKYKHLSDVEGQLLLVKTIETFKNHLDTSRDNKIIIEDGKPKEFKGNEKNAKLFDDFLRALLYEQKYPLSDSDMALGIGKVMNYMKMAVNNVAGSEVFGINDNPSALSLVKTMDAANRYFQVKTLGLEFISGAVNAFGGNIQIATQAGNYFKAGEFMANERKLIGNNFSKSDEREMFIQLIDKFMPMKDDPTYEKLRDAGMSVLTRQNFTDLLMVFMRSPEQHLEKSVFLTLVQNMMVENGKIVSIREFIKSKYKDRFASAEKYKQLMPQIEEEIQELKKTKSIDATKILVDGKLEIPGLDMNNVQEMQRLTNLTRQISRNATGALSNSDLNRMGMNIWTKSMMIFKNWIPKLVDTRFSEFRRVADDFSVVINEDGLTTGEKYDIGRIRLWGYIIGTSIKDKTSNMYNILTLNDKGLEALDKMYYEFAEKYKETTGEDMNMTKEDFIDMIRTNLQNQVKELAMLLSLFGAMLALGFMVPDEEEDRASKNFYRYTQKVIDKFVTELSFFYNPIEFQKMLKGSAFPALGIFNDIEKFINHFFMQTTGLDLSNPDLSPEEVFKKAQPIKYAAKLFPVTKSVITYISLFDSDFAKEYNITVQKEVNR